MIHHLDRAVIHLLARIVHNRLLQVVLDHAHRVHIPLSQLLLNRPLDLLFQNVQLYACAVARLYLLFGHQSLHYKLDPRRLIYLVDDGELLTSNVLQLLVLYGELLHVDRLVLIRN